jgi:hypothetical protein
MKKNQTPQQPQPMFNGETKGVYAIDENGNYVLTRTAGWDPETIALKQALEEIDRLTDDALDRARSGHTSPLEYHMCAHRMDVPMLARAAGKFKWQIRRHFRPSVFEKLSTSQLETYAQILDTDVETLKKLPE